MRVLLDSIPVVRKVSLPSKHGGACRKFGRFTIFALCSPAAYIVSVGKRWATVTVTDSNGRRHSVDVQACSTFDAAHLFVAHAKSNPQNEVPPLGPDTVFEVIAGGAIHYIKGAALQRWIHKERQERKGPARLLFSQRADVGMIQNTGPSALITIRIDVVWVACQQGRRDV